MWLLEYFHSLDVCDRFLVETSVQKINSYSIKYMFRYETKAVHHDKLRRKRWFLRNKQTGGRNINLYDYYIIQDSFVFLC